MLSSPSSMSSTILALAVLALANVPSSLALLFSLLTSFYFLVFDFACLSPLPFPYLIYYDKFVYKHASLRAF